LNQPLFDNRYRYDHIFPRGRSGETLQAVDTQDRDRPVVIKRPAPQDAPPLRAAQEVSIRAERKALERLSGHPNLTELRGTGAFRAGGNTYQYIAMDRAMGETVEEMVLALAAHDRHPPELELLVIIDGLLDLLMKAHAQHVIYNDVDAKHLFWNRDDYRLKVIDWGNAVLTDEAGHQAGVTVANDVHQVGELLYFAYQSGARMASETSPDGDYTVHFREALPDTIQDIITKATHPNIKSQRYSSIRNLREELSAYRHPLERERDQITQSVQSKLTDNASKQLLESLRVELNGALELDPGHPAARSLADDIALRLQHLAVQADFDAARIYLETGNWSRAIHLVEELIPNADEQTARALTFLVAAAEQFEKGGHSAPPDEFGEVIDAALHGQSRHAAAILMAIAEHDHNFRTDALLAAERLVAAFPNVSLLRPHLIRLEQELAPLDAGLTKTIIKQTVAIYAPVHPGISPLIERYGRLAIQLTDRIAKLEQVAAKAGIAAETLTQPAERAEAAAHAVVDHLKRAAFTAFGHPGAARSAIDEAQAIDPANPHFAALPAYLENMHRTVASLATFRPNPDASNLLGWLQTSLDALRAYEDDISDAEFRNVLRDLSATGHNWVQVADMLVMGRKTQPAERLKVMGDTMRPYNLNAADWFQKTAQLINDAREVERFAANPELGEALLQGYRAWDTGQAGRAADSARKAMNLAQSDGEKRAVERLQNLSEITATWLTQNGIHDSNLTKKSEKAAFALLLEDEISEYDRFSGQMPNEELYLRAMKLGIVKAMRDSSSAGIRALFLHYMWRGALELQDSALDDAEFWREAALNCGDIWKTHPVFTAFDGELQRQRLIMKVETALNQISSFEDIPAARDILNTNSSDDWLKSSRQALTLIEEALGPWADGSFRAARDNFNEAQDHIRAAEEDAAMNLDNLRQWVTPFQERAEELAERRQIVEQAAMAGSLEANPDVLRALEQIVNISEAALGADYSRQVKLWRDLYRTMLKTHLDQRLTKQEKLAEFDKNFAALFIEKHPAHRLFQRWHNTARMLPDDVREDLQIDLDTDTTTEQPVYMDGSEGQNGETPPEYEDYENVEIRARRPKDADYSGGDRSWNWIIIIAGVILLGLVGFAVLRAMTGGADDPVRNAQATPTRDAILSPENATRTAEAQGIVAPPTRTRIPPSTTPTNTAPPPTDTRIPPSATPTEDLPTIAPTLTPTQAVTIVTNTPPPSPTATIFIPSATPVIEVASGNQVDVLEILNLIQPEDYGWEPGFFSRGAGDVWQLGASVEEAGSAPIAVVFSPDFMEAFSPDSGLRVREVTVQMELTLFDEDRIENQQVFFGLGLQNTRRQRYSSQVQLRQVGVVSLGINENGRFTAISQIPLAQVNVTLSLRRDPDGSVTFFINGQRLGQSPTLFPLDEPVSIVLYNAGGGMFVAVSSFTIELTPFGP
jgi:hypothetical protein